MHDLTSAINQKNIKSHDLQEWKKIKIKSGYVRI